MAEEKHSARDLEYWYKLWVKSHWDSVVVFDCGGRMLRCEGISLRHVTIIGQCMLIIASKLPDEIIRRFNDSMVNDHMLIDAYVAGVKIGKFAWMLSGGEFMSITSDMDDTQCISEQGYMEWCMGAIKDDEM